MESLQSRSKGSEWKSRICFVPKAHENGSMVYVTDDELKCKLKNLVDSSEEIKEVFIYKVPLTDVQITDIIFHHAYVVLKTNKWWWSIEKNTEGTSTNLGLINIYSRYLFQVLLSKGLRTLSLYAINTDKEKDPIIFGVMILLCLENRQLLESLL